MGMLLFCRTPQSNVSAGAVSEKSGKKLKIVHKRVSDWTKTQKYEKNTLKNKVGNYRESSLC